MKRTIIADLIKWKTKSDRKPLIIRGARQVGKTWIMKEFGETEYAQILYVNFESNSRLKDLFNDNFDIPRIIMGLQIETGVSFKPDNTLIILDEIQEAPRAITALKYFYENNPDYHIVAAGSLLGVALQKDISFPVGKVDFLDLYPMSYTEFLEALGQKALVDLLNSRDWAMISTFKTKYIQFLRQYYYVGGMPEVVLSFCNTSDFNSVREIQKRILIAYEQDFSKHAPNEIVPRIRMLWNSIPAQLAKENKKFIYGIIKRGARAKDYELAFSWLTDCGLVQKINQINKPAIPLKAYEDFNYFKLFLLDVGLLLAMGNVDVKTLLEGNQIFQEFKGAVTEQYVMQQLIADKELTLNYWSIENSTAEIDFITQYQGNIIPIEVKAEENLKAKSLRLYCQKYQPELAIRTSMSDYRKEEWFTNLPLYAISQIKSV